MIVGNAAGETVTAGDNWLAVAGCGWHTRGIRRDEGSDSPVDVRISSCHGQSTSLAAARSAPLITSSLPPSSPPPFSPLDEQAIAVAGRSWSSSLSSFSVQVSTTDVR